MADAKTPTAVYRDERLAEIRKHINMLRTALHELALNMDGTVYPLDETAWPNVDYPDDHVLAKRRLRLLAEIVYATSFALEHITEMDLKPAAAYARNCVRYFGGVPARGWDKPLGRAGTAPAKEELLLLVTDAVTQATEKGTAPADTIADALVKWIAYCPAADGGARELTDVLKVNCHDRSIRATLRRALASACTKRKIDEEEVIRTAWKALGAPPAFVKNLFSYKRLPQSRTKSKQRGV